MNNQQSAINNKPLKIAIVVIIIALGVFFVFNLISKNSQKGGISNNGYLVLNTEKTNYLSGEKVVIKMSALGKDGQTLCNANLQLSINNEKVNGLKKFSTCSNNYATYDPDFIYEFTPPKTGTYQLKLTDLDTKYSATRKFTVGGQNDLNIVRLSPTRINPEKEPRYSMIFSVTANKDFKGEISDIVPAGVSIPWQGPAVITDNPDGSKKITWQVDLKKGETAEFPYEFVVPVVSPAIYRFGENGEWSVVAAK